MDRMKAIDLVTAWYDRPGAALLAPAFTCQAIGYPVAKAVYTGPGEMLATFFGEISAQYEVWSVVVERMIDAGADVTVLGHYQAKKTGDAQRALPFVHVWSARSGALVRVVCCRDTG